MDGKKIQPVSAEKLVYIMLHKPVGYASTLSDPNMPKTVMELIDQVEERVYPVGRLDIDSSGLLLLTNDGDFAFRMTHPRYHVPKVYRVRAKGFVDRDAAKKLAEGIDLPEGRTAPASLRFVDYHDATQSTILEITIYEGRNRQVRRMLESVGHPVRELQRIAFGCLRLKGLNSGTWRKLRPDEIEALLAMAQPTSTPPKQERREKPPYRPRNPAKPEPVEPPYDPDAPRPPRPQRIPRERRKK